MDEIYTIGIGVFVGISKPFVQLGPAYVNVSNRKFTIRERRHYMQYMAARKTKPLVEAA
jgi:hypothetical protein